MGIVGILHAAGPAPEAFDLDREYTVPAFFSAGLLFLAAAMVFAMARGEAGLDRSLLILIAAAFAFLAFDELFSIHERIDIRTDVDWQGALPARRVGFLWAHRRLTHSLGCRTQESLMIFRGLGAWVSNT